MENSQKSKANEQKITSPFQLVKKANRIPKINLDLVRRFRINQNENSEEEQRPLAIRWLEKNLKENIMITDSKGEIHIFNTLEKKKILMQKIESSWLYCVDSEPEKGETFAIGTLNSNLHIYKNQIWKYGKVIKSTINYYYLDKAYDNFSWS